MWGGHYNITKYICHTTSIHLKNIYGHPSENFYDVNLYTLSYIELEYDNEYDTPSECT
jgi:hypothetical protein